MNICLINGPNLNMLGIREPEVYGNTTLDDIVTKCHEIATALGLSMDSFQSNSESKLIDRIHQCVNEADWIVINAGGLTHTSVALHDALSLFPGSVIEVHISNIHAREPFRHTSLISGIAKGVIMGFGPASYYMAINAIPDQTLEK